MIGRIRGPFCGFFDGRKAKRTRKGLDREARKEERRLNRPSLTVIIPRMDREAEKFWRGVSLSSFLETRND